MFLHGISVGIGLLSLSFILFYRYGQIDSKFAAGIIALLSWLASGPFFFTHSELTAQLFVASLPLVFFAILPLLYWYQQSLITEQPWQLSRRSLLQLIPSAIALSLSLSIFLMPSNAFTTLFFEDAERLTLWSTIIAAWFALMTLLWFLLSSIYLYRIVSDTRAYHQGLKNIFANHSNKKLNWFNFFVVCLLITWLYNGLVLVFDDSLANFYPNQTGTSLLLLVLIWVFCLHALQQKPAFAEIIMTDAEPYLHSAIDSERLQRIAGKIEQVVIAEQAYLDPDINAVKLSVNIGVSAHYLSQTFSQQMHTTFYDYINAARIEAAKTDLKHSNKTVLDIATDVGFNARSAFYNAFKKFTGQTPSAYRKQHITA